MCSCDDGEYPEFCDTTMPRARKEHVCDDCRRKVTVGERYMRVSGKWDGEVGVYVICRRCQLLRDAFEIAEDGCRPPLGDLMENLRECMRHDVRFVAKFREAYLQLWGAAAA